MKTKIESNFDDIVDSLNTVVAFNYFGINTGQRNYYSSLPYNEERDRWTLRTFEPVARTNPLNQPGKLENAALLKGANTRQARQGFWQKLLGQKA